MSNESEIPEPQEADMRGALPALRRAAKEARELSIRTGTPFWVLQDGKIVDLNAEAVKKFEQDDL